MNKKGQGAGLIGGLIASIIGLVVVIIIGLVVVQTLNDSSLLTAGSDEESAVGNLTANLTSGIGKVSSKIPTILTVAAVVILLGVLAFLVTQARRSGMFGAGGSSL